MAELRAADFVARLIRTGVLKSDEYREERLHRIGGAGKLESFSAASKNDVSWPFLKQLRDLGRHDAKEWLEANFDAIGAESTLDIDRALQRDPAKPPTKGAPAAFALATSALQRFLNAAGRFSAKARMPSFWSSVANSEWKMRRSKRTPSASVVS